jgi:hypothetical protein
MKNPTKKDMKQMKITFPSIFKEISSELSKDPEGKVRKISMVDIRVSRAINEIEFKYEARIDYVDPRTEEPTNLYGLKNGIIWISEDQHLLIINIDDWILVPILCKYFADYFQSSIETIYLTKDIIDDILGKDSLISGSWHNSFPKPGKAKDKILRNPSLLMIEEGREVNETYLRKSSYHKIRLGDIDVGTSVVEQYGRISIRRHLMKSDIRDWAFTLSSRIINRINSLRRKSPRNYFYTLDPIRINSLNSIKGLSTKRYLLEIAGFIAEMRFKHESMLPFQGNITIFNTRLKPYFSIIVSPFCPVCDSSDYKCKNCGISDMASLYGRGYNVKCQNCGKEFKDIKEGLSCINDHELMGSVYENLNAYMNPTGRDLINLILQEKKIPNLLENNELVIIEHKSIQILRIDYKSEYLFNEISEFSQIPTLIDIRNSKNKYSKISELENLIDHLKEKCKNHGAENCKTCLRNIHGFCIQRLVAYFSGGDLGPHHGLEYGDLSFQTKIDGKLQTIVCLGKRYQGKSHGARYTLKNDAGLPSQVYKATRLDSIDFIAIVSGQDLDAQLKEYIRSLIESRRKKLILVCRDELIRFAAEYVFQTKSKISQLLKDAEYFQRVH